MGRENVCVCVCGRRARGDTWSAPCDAIAAPHLICIKRRRRRPTTQRPGSPTLAPLFSRRDSFAVRRAARSARAQTTEPRCIHYSTFQTHMWPFDGSTVDAAGWQTHAIKDDGLVDSSAATMAPTTRTTKKMASLHRASQPAREEEEREREKNRYSFRTESNTTRSDGAEGRQQNNNSTKKRIRSGSWSAGGKQRGRAAEAGRRTATSLAAAKAGPAVRALITSPGFALAFIGLLLCACVSSVTRPKALFPHSARGGRCFHRQRVVVAGPGGGCCPSGGHDPPVNHPPPPTRKKSCLQCLSLRPSTTTTATSVDNNSPSF